MTGLGKLHPNLIATPGLKLHLHMSHCGTANTFRDPRGDVVMSNRQFAAIRITH